MGTNGRGGSIFSLSRFLLPILILAAQLPIAASSVRAQENASGSWLDRPLTNWNTKAGEPPTPSLVRNSADVIARCPGLIRLPDRPSERELVSRGWMLYGPVQSYGLTKVVTALSGADRMCRPLGYQAFVFWNGSYAGSLSPAPMDSRANGSLTHFHLVSANRISAEFARYREVDDPCCPSQISYVNYEISGESGPLVGPVEITKLPVAAAGEPQRAEVFSDDADQLFEKNWRLIELRGANVSGSSAYLKFEREARRFSGNGGCNVIVGRFAVEGPQLKLIVAMSTRMACLDADAQQIETEFLDALSHTTRFQIQGDTLRLYDWGSCILALEAESTEVAAAPQLAQVTGTISYAQRTALSDDAVLEIQLRDVTAGVTLKEPIAKQVINLKGTKFPIAFELPYDREQIDDTHRYGIQAHVTDGGRKRPLSSRLYPVITKGNPTRVNVVIRALRR